MVSNKMKYLKNKPWEPIFFKRSYFTVLGVLSFETINILMTVPLSYFFNTATANRPCWHYVASTSKIRLSVNVPGCRELTSLFLTFDFIALPAAPAARPLGEIRLTPGELGVLDLDISYHETQNEMY
jgi:hypothetical protein